jgi:hypothetical protein
LATIISHSQAGSPRKGSSGLLKYVDNDTHPDHCLQLHPSGANIRDGNLFHGNAADGRGLERATVPAMKGGRLRPILKARTFRLSGSNEEFERLMIQAKNTSGKLWC